MRAGKADNHAFFAVFLDDFGMKIRGFGRDGAGVKTNDVSGVQAFGVFDKRMPGQPVFGAVQCDFNQGFAAGTVKPGRNDLSVV